MIQFALFSSFLGLLDYGQADLMELFLLPLFIDYGPYPLEDLEVGQSALLHNSIWFRAGPISGLPCLLGLLAALDHAKQVVQYHVKGLWIWLPEHSPAELDAVGPVPAEGFEQR
jgi:hypothetical protein